MKNIPNIHIAWLCDTDKKALLDAKKHFSRARATPNYHDVLMSPDVDAVLISTPAPSHYSFARQALLADKHIFIEKPMTCLLADATRLVILAKQKKKILFVDHTYVYDDAIRATKDVVGSGQLGNTYAAHSIRTNLGKFQHDCNVLWDLAPHDIAILSFILKTNPQSVIAHGWSHFIPGLIDTAWLSIDFGNKINATIFISWLFPKKERILTIVGSKQMIVFDDTITTKKLRVYKSNVTVRHRKTMPQFVHESRGILYPSYNNQEPLMRACQNFVLCIRTHREPLTNSAHGRMVVATIAAAESSIQQNGKVVSVRL